MFPDFGKLTEAGDNLSKQFERIIKLLELIEKNTRPIDHQAELQKSATMRNLQEMNHG